MTRSISDTMIQYVEKPRGNPVEYCPLGVPRTRTRGAAGYNGFWPWNLLRDNIYHNTPKAFPHITILL